MVSFVTAIGSWSKLQDLAHRPKAIGMIVCSGVAGGLSWIFAFRALKLAHVSQVAPIDKLSMPLGILLAVIILGRATHAHQLVWNFADCGRGVSGDVVTGQTSAD